MGVRDSKTLVKGSENTIKRYQSDFYLLVILIFFLHVGTLFPLVLVLVLVLDRAIDGDLREHTLPSLDSISTPPSGNAFALDKKLKANVLGLLGLNHV